MSEFRRRKTERTRGRKVSSFNKLKDLKNSMGNWRNCFIAVLIPLLTLVWYSNNQNENVTNPWKNGQLAKSKEGSSSDSKSSQVDTSSLSDQQLGDCFFLPMLKNKAQLVIIIKI